MLDMEEVTKDIDLSHKEKLIIDQLDSNDYLYTQTFNFIYNHYLVNFLMSKSNHFLVLKAVYLEKIDFPKWKLANYCNISKTSLYDYRNDIINCFYTCLKENIAIKEISNTKG